MQQPESSSNSHSDDNIDPAVPAVPSWDEFNTNQGSSSNHAEEDDENGEHASLSHPLEPLCSVEEFGPVPPQGYILYLFRSY
jgi:hypothetical protein